MSYGLIQSPIVLHPKIPGEVLQFICFPDCTQSPPTDAPSCLACRDINRRTLRVSCPVLKGHIALFVRTSWSMKSISNNLNEMDRIGKMF